MLLAILWLRRVGRPCGGYQECRHREDLLVDPGGAQPSQVALVIKNLSANAGDAGDPGSIPESGRSPGEGNGTHSSVLAWRILSAEEPGQRRRN